MSLMKHTGEYIYGRKYNVEYELGNGSIHTFSNILSNVDNKYFWFDSPEDGMDFVRQDRIITMVCLDKNKKIDNMTKEAIEESMDALNDIRSYFNLEVKCTCDEIETCERCTYINKLGIVIQRMRNLIQKENKNE